MSMHFRLIRGENTDATIEMMWNGGMADSARSAQLSWRVVAVTAT